jgi:hypothetical protein
MIIDDKTVITGSFNFTKAAEAKMQKIYWLLGITRSLLAISKIGLFIGINRLHGMNSSEKLEL